MQTKDKKNLNNKIAFKNLLVPKNLLYSNTEKINIQTIKIDKAKNYLNEDKRFFSSKNLKKIRYLNNTSINYNIKSKNYRQNDEQISFYDSSESNRSPSPINSLNQSSYITYTKKKKQKRHQKQNAIKNYQYCSSINNISFNSNVNNTIFLNSSSSSSSDNDYSESSEISYRSRDNKRKNYFDQMMIEENELDYLKKSEVGIITSEEEDNNNSLDNSNFIEENFNNEIERILIEIYNNNITLISSGNYNEINKNSSQVKDVEKQIKNYLKRENLKTNLKVLRTLSNKIKELVGKYKEKVFEIKEIKSIYEIIQRRQLLINNQIIHCNNSGESNVATNSNSNSLDYSFNEEDNYNFSNLISNLQDEKPDILLRELINIKKTLKISSENGKKIKFSIELMQREEFCKTLLNDEIISTILKHIKEIFCQNNSSNIIKMIEELEENCDHKNEMTRFVEYINNKLEKKKNENNKLDENKNENDEQINDNVNNKNHKEKKGKKRNNNENKNNNDEKEIDFKDIDALLNYINEDTDSKKGKKKGKKSKKNKKQNKKEEKEIIQDNNNYYDDITNNLGYEFEKEFENFKKEIEESSINIYNTNKIIPCLSNDFIKNISEL